MYIMTHFLKNVLTFLFRYDIYISFCSKFVLGQKLPFALSEPLFRKERTMNNSIGCGGCILALALWAGSVSFVSWILMLLFGALHDSGLGYIPHLSFWQAVGFWLIVSTIAIPFRGGRSRS